MKKINSLKLLSIITPVLNNVKDIEICLMSVVDQSYTNKEHWIIDGGSNDGSLEVIKSYNNHIAKWVSENDDGIYDAMNKEMRLANGNYVGFLNAGDLYYNNNTLSELFSNIIPTTDIVYGDMILINGHEDRKKYHKASDFTIENLIDKSSATVCHQSLFAKRIITPSFNTNYKIKADLNWYFDILLKNKEIEYQYVPTPVVYYDANDYAFQNFWLNNWELIKVIYRQYGIKTLLDYNYTNKIFLKYKWWKTENK